MAKHFVYTCQYFCKPPLVLTEPQGTLNSSGCLWKTTSASRQGALSSDLQQALAVFFFFLRGYSHLVLKKRKFVVSQQPGLRAAWVVWIQSFTWTVPSKNRVWLGGRSTTERREVQVQVLESSQGSHGTLSKPLAQFRISSKVFQTSCFKDVGHNKHFIDCL